MSLWKWSQTASSDATADPSINWAEGMAPSAVNDSGRAMMAAVAKYRDDIAGAITTGGTSTAYTLSSYQSFDTLAHMSGAMIAFVPHATSGAAPTLNVDGLGAKPLRTVTTIDMLGGVLIQGTPYVATYNNSNSEWVLHGLAGNPYGMPLAGLIPTFATSAPNSAFVFPYGQAISRSTYSTLFSIFSTTYGIGDGSTTFNIPDIRGRVLAGKDDMGGSAASRITTAGSSVDGLTLGASGGAQNITLDTTMIPSHTHSITDPGHVHRVPPPLPTEMFVFDRAGSGGFSPTTGGLSGVYAISNTQSATTGITGTNSSGGGLAHNNMQPTIICNYIMRVI